MRCSSLVLTLVLALAVTACRPKAPEAPSADAKPVAQAKPMEQPAQPPPAAPDKPAPAAEVDFPDWTGTVDKDLIVGIWNGEEEIGSGWDDAYLFWADGRFEFRYNQMDCAKRTLADKGFWTMDGGSAVLTVHEELIAVGGKVVDADGSCIENKDLIGAEEQSRPVEPPLATRLDLSGLERHPDFDSPILTINKRRFHKKAADPKDYQ